MKAVGLRLVTYLFLVSFIFLSGCSSLLKPRLTQSLVEIKEGEYSLDAAHTTVLFKIDHMGFSKFVGRFNSVEANLDFNANDPERSSLEATVDMTSVDVNNAKFERALRGKFWFNAQQFPQAVFRTRSAKRISENLLRFEGELTFLGITRPIQLDVTVNGAANNLISGKYTLGFSATTKFNRSDFGLDRYIPTVGDEVELEIHAEFQRN